MKNLFWTVHARDVGMAEQKIGRRQDPAKYGRTFPQSHAITGGCQLSYWPLLPSANCIAES